MSATRPGHARPPVWSDSALDHLRAACVGLALLAPAALAAAEVPISVVQFPVAIDLTGLFAKADAALPTQAGQWPRWESWHGLEIRYQAWRGVLALAMRGPVILAQAHVRYRLQARKGLIGALALSAGCGVDEPPRQALVGVMARLDWTPDWLLHPRFRVLPTRPLDPCELTLADIDVSPLVGRAFESRLETALGDALSGLAPRLAAMRAEAARAWLGIQTPRELAPGLWLHVQPLGVALAPPRGAEARLETSLWIAARLTLSADASPAGPPVPLPPLVPYRPLEPGLRFALSLEPGLRGSLAGPCQSARRAELGDPRPYRDAGFTGVACEGRGSGAGGPRRRRSRRPADPDRASRIRPRERVADPGRLGLCF